MNMGMLRDVLDEPERSTLVKGLSVLITQCKDVLHNSTDCDQDMIDEVTLDLQRAEHLYKELTLTEFIDGHS